MSDFNVGDWACFKGQHSESDEVVYEILGWNIFDLLVIKAKGKLKRRVAEYVLRHATQEEIDAGRRLS